MPMPHRLAAFAVASLLAVGCTHAPAAPVQVRDMSSIAESYVKLVLALGEHDSNYVDAFYGPAGWREQAKAAKKALPAIRSEAEALIAELDRTAAPAAGSPEALRRAYLTRQLQALIAWADHLGGKRLPFDEESRALYDAVAPVNSLESFQPAIDELDRALPGTGPLHERYEAYRKKFEIPSDRVDAVFKVAIDACRERTAKHLSMPPADSFVLEYVTGKSWSGYNWYQGGYKSLIQVNVSLPILIDRAIDLACHEGYPGHHVYNALLEHNLVKQRGWIEFTVYPLYSPQSLIAEGSANYGIDLAFPGDERVRFEREQLFPLAGLDASEADAYYRIAELAKKVAYAGNEVARRRLNGALDAKAAADLLVRYALMSPDRAEQRVKFMDLYRSYVINYNLGQDIVRNYVEAKAGDSIEARWKVFADLLSSPRLPSALVTEAAGSAKR